MGLLDVLVDLPGRRLVTGDPLVLAAHLCITQPGLDHAPPRSSTRRWSSPRRKSPTGWPPRGARSWDGALGGADLGVVGEVAGEADGCLGHGVPVPVPGRAVCPALGPGGRWTPWHAERPPGASGGTNEVGPTGSGCRAGSARVPSWLAALAASG